MKKSVLVSLLFVSFSLIAKAGEMEAGKEMKQVVPPPPCDEWYRDTEWNVSLWGTYVFTAEDWDNDKYIEADHAWGGGMDLKYFFHRYFGVGLEGWAIEARRERLLGLEPIPATQPQFAPVFDHDDRLVGAVKGTFTLRYPIHCSRFAPYIYGGAGAIFGGGESDSVSIVQAITRSLAVPRQQPSIIAHHHDGDPEFLGQIGAGFEVRVTRHIGFINDFSWNFVAKDDSDFGMVRAGVDFAF